MLCRCDLQGITELTGSENIHTHLKEDFWKFQGGEFGLKKQNFELELEFVEGLRFGGWSQFRSVGG